MSDFFSSILLLAALQSSSSEERTAITQSLEVTAVRPLAPRDLRDRICRSAGHGVFNALRGEGVAYLELLFDACETLKVQNIEPRYSKIFMDHPLSTLDNRTLDRAKIVLLSTRLELIDRAVNDLERKLLSKLMSVAYERASPQQKAAVDAQLAAFSRTKEGRQLSGLSTSAALLVAGNLGGFATYTMMSTVLSAMSLGTLGFGAYTFASSMLSVVLGPAGWLMLGIYGVVKIGGPDKAKIVRLASTCALVGQRLREEDLASMHDSSRESLFARFAKAAAQAPISTGTQEGYAEHSARLAAQRKLAYAPGAKAIAVKVVRKTAKANENSVADVMEQLKIWRKRVALKQSVPPFVIFHDTTLQLMAEQAPQSLHELAKIRGIGPSKLEAYGADLLTILRTTS